MFLLIARFRPFCRQCCLLLAAACLASAARPAMGQVGSDRYAAIVIDAASGSILSAANPDDLRFPASLTKMMTLYMLFEAIRDRRVTLNQYVPVSANAASMPATKLDLTPNTRITVEQAILGLVTKSANDAACALGEMLGGDEDRFAQMMTLRARALGMTRTQFRNASGLPDWSQVTTARDMAILARHLVQDFPGYYHYFSTPSFVFGGRVIRNHQRLLESYPGADGLKTGYTEAAGFNVVTSAVHGDVRLIGVVLGAGNGGERDVQMAGLLDQAFDRVGAPSATMVQREFVPSPRLPAFAHATPVLLPVPPRLTNPNRAVRLPERTPFERPLRHAAEARPARAAVPAAAAPTRPQAVQVAHPAASTRAGRYHG